MHYRKKGPSYKLKSRSQVTRVWSTKLSLSLCFSFLFVLYSAVIYALFMPLCFFFFALYFSFQAHWLFESTSPSLVLVICLRQMAVDGPEEGCECACVTGIDFVCVYEYVCGSKYVCKHPDVCVRGSQHIVGRHVTTELGTQVCLV